MLEPESRRLPKDVLPRHYHIDFTPKPSSRPEMGFETFSASVAITLDIVDTTRSFKLNAVGLRPHSCTFDGMMGEMLLNDAMQQLTIRWPRDIRGGTSGVLTISYDGDVLTGTTGLYQNSYHGGKRRGIATQMEMAEARRFLPCWDEPCFKATFDLTIVVPSFYVVLFNAGLVETPTTVEPGLTRHVFEKTPIMSSYLLAIFVGEAEFISSKTVRGVDVRVWCPVGHKDLGELVLADGVKMLEYFEEFYGVPYAMKKLDFIGLDTFAYGGMENWGLVMYGSSQIYLQPDAMVQSRVRAAYIVAHELAHMWFGNLVTMAWWNDLWLNESFATYAGWMAVKQVHPEWDVDAIVFSQEIERALTADSFKSTHPVIVDATMDDPVLLGNMCDSITYCKGFACLMMTAKFCTERGFTEGVRDYVKKFAYTNTHSTDLFDCLSKASGKDVVSFMTKWTEYTGFPVVHVERNGDTLTLRQERFVAGGGAAPPSPPWPLEITLSWGKGQSVIDFSTHSMSTKLSLLAANNPPYILLDPGSRMMLRTVYSRGMWVDIVKHALQLAPVARMGLINSRIALCSAGLLSSGDVLQLVLVLERETNARVMLYMMTQLETYFCSVWARVTRNDGGDTMAELCARLMYRLGNAVLERFGATPKVGEDPVCRDLRAKAFRPLVKDPNHELHRWYVEQFPNWRKLSMGDLILACDAVGFDRTEKLYEEVKGGSVDLSSTLVAVLGRMEVSDEDKPKKVELLRRLPSGMIFSYVSSFNDTQHMRAMLYQNWMEIVGRMNVSNPLTRMFLSAHQKESSLALIADIDVFLNGLPNEDRKLLEATANQARECIIANNKWVERDYLVVRELLASAGAIPDVSVPTTPRAADKSMELAVDDDSSKNGTNKFVVAAEAAGLVVFLGVVGYGAYWIGRKLFHHGESGQ